MTRYFQWHGARFNWRSFNLFSKWVLMLKNQTINLIFNLSFCYIIYSSWHWMKNAHSFSIFRLKNLSNEFLGSNWTLFIITFLLQRFETFWNFNSQNNSHLKVLKIHLLSTLPHLQKCVWVLQHFPIWHSILCLNFDYKPNTNVVT